MNKLIGTVTTYCSPLPSIAQSLSGEPVRYCLVLLLVLTAGTAIAQAPSIRAGSTIFIEPIHGYETDLAVALVKRGVRLVIVQDRTKADLILRSTLSAHTPLPPVVVLSNNGVPSTAIPLAHDLPESNTVASITVYDVRFSRVVFEYSVGKGADTNERKSTAEACAKHLKQFMVSPGK
jgi:hypothetical protein